MFVPKRPKWKGPVICWKHVVAVPPGTICPECLKEGATAPRDPHPVQENIMPEKYECHVRVDPLGPLTTVEFLQISELVEYDTEGKHRQLRVPIAHTYGYTKGTGDKVKEMVRLANIGHDVAVLGGDMKVDVREEQRLSQGTEQAPESVEHNRLIAAAAVGAILTVLGAFAALGVHHVLSMWLK